MKIKIIKDEDGQVIELEEVKDTDGGETETKTDELELSDELLDKLVVLLLPKMVEAMKTTTTDEDLEEEDPEEVKDADESEEKEKAVKGKHDSAASVKVPSKKTVVDEVSRDEEIAKAFASRKGVN